ncbi:MAG TPA: hypothetical protein VJJ75_01240, partial [Candidatus Nanoarchaeia archaeon]|nr:hypothetical protein [Candidatus Nanoarchaeia archaeon]
MAEEEPTGLEAQVFKGVRRTPEQEKKGLIFEKAKHTSSEEEIRPAFREMAEESKKKNKIGMLRVKDTVLEATVTEKGRYELVKRLFYDE